MTNAQRMQRDEQIINEYRMGMPAKILAKKYGLSHNYIQHLMWGKRVVYGSNISAIPINNTIEKVCKIFNVSKTTLLTRCRKNEYVRARFALYILTREQDYTYSQISRRLGMHHTTIISGIARAVELQQNDEGFRKMVELCR